MLVTKLRQDQAADSQNTKCIPLCIIAFLDIMAVYVTQGLSEPHSQCTPSFPLSGLFPKSVLGVIGESGSEQSFPDEGLTIITSWPTAPLAHSIFDEDGRLAGYLLPLFVLHVRLHMSPQVRIEYCLIHCIVAGASILQLEDGRLDHAAGFT